ncbi:hypothetical protein [Nonomuraea rhizosphaerae]|uniref:hypothetical protein n=1 Tax=Nonomuraea rhizosphaerae TaxID=2665663 RepID=UPI001C5D0545|nr:hypothetical protein [Nonomuraea rhizosphaerae]
MTMPGRAWGGWEAPPPRGDSWREFFRQRPAQILGAGLIGLIIGGVLGGGSVALVAGLSHRGEDRFVYWEHRGFPDYPGYNNCRGPYCNWERPYGGIPMPQPSVVLPSMAPASPVPTTVPSPESAAPKPSKSD